MLYQTLAISFSIVLIVSCVMSTKASGEIKLLRDETFSGLNLLSMMHVGVRQFDKHAVAGSGLDEDIQNSRRHDC